ncbi:MAG: hypothetical protein EBX39_06845 [Actinobacteria bacterium]|nr:hypothetical protein [Actinomycetota bacterium]
MSRVSTYLNFMGNTREAFEFHRSVFGTEFLESMGHQLQIGTNVSINLEPDTRAETERLLAALSEGSDEGAPLADMPWGASWGSCLDRFGIRWMFNCYEPAP